MKRIVTVLALAMICSSAFAQFNQGRWLAGGSVGFRATTSKTKSNSTTVTNSHSTYFTIAPDVGYFVIDKLAVGASLALVAGSNKQEGSSNKTTGSSISLSPFVRYYLDQGIFFQGQFGFGHASSKTKNANGSTTTKYGTSNWSLAAGYAYFLNDYVAVEPSVGYVSNTDKYKNPDAKFIDGSIFLNVGLQVYLGPRK
ncbi:MAG: hypothetical protein WDO14_22950 [Bacteroidota bacterium]